jgi:general secretion pathway protein A
VFLEYYKLAEQPFGVTPNPRYLFLTPTHREAMASILYAVMENRGFSALIAPPGMGKTTLLFDLLQRFGDSTRTIFLFQFQPTPEGLLRNILAELEIPDEGESFVGMQEKLNQAILSEAKRGRRIVVVVDEAQNFCAPV